MTDTIEIDRYVVETLMRDLVGHDRRAASYLVFLSLIAAGGGKPVALSHQQLADKTGLSKRSVQDAIAHLVLRGLLEINRRNRTEPAFLYPVRRWRR